MEPLLKRRRLGLDEPDEQLHYGRALNNSRLKASFESIFKKYGKDFTEVGDEIDLETGEIVVNNGHLLSMRNEQDIDGGGNDLDELYGLDSSPRNREPNVFDAKTLTIPPELTESSLKYDHNEREIRDDDVDSLMGDIEYLDNALAVASPLGATDRDITGLAGRSILSPPPSATYVNGPTTTQSSVQPQIAHQQSIYQNSRDLATDPEWIVPPLPDLQTSRTPQSSQDKLQMLRDNTQRSSSPPGDSLWATREMQSLQKHSRKKWLKDEDALLRHLKLSTDLTYVEMQPRFPDRGWNALRKRWGVINPVKKSSVHWSQDKDKLIRHMTSNTNLSLPEITERLPGRSKLDIEHHSSSNQGLTFDKEIPNGDRVHLLASENDHLIQFKTSQQASTPENPLAKIAEFSLLVAQVDSALPTPLSLPRKTVLRDRQPSAAEVHILPREIQILPAEVILSSAKVQTLANVDEPLQTPLEATRTFEPRAKTPMSRLRRHSRTLRVVIERSSHSPIITGIVSLSDPSRQLSQLQSPPESVDHTDSPTSSCSRNKIGRDPSYLGPDIIPDGLCMFPPQLTAALSITPHVIEHRRDSSDAARTRPDTLPEESTPLPEDSVPLPEDSTPLPRESTSLPGGSSSLAPSPDLRAQEFRRVFASPEPEIPPIVQDEYQEPLQAQAPLGCTSQRSVTTSVKLAQQENTPPPEFVNNPQALSSEGVQGLLEPSRDELDFTSILSTPARYPTNTAGSSKRLRSAPRKRKKRSSSVAVTSFGAILGDLSDDELSLPTVTCSRVLSAEKAKVVSPNRQCGSAGFRCDRKVCLRCT